MNFPVIHPDADSLDPNQAQHFIGPDLNPIRLQRLSADDTSRQRGEVLLILKAPIMTAADDKFCNIFPNFQKKIRYDIT